MFHAAQAKPSSAGAGEQAADAGHEQWLHVARVAIRATASVRSNVPGNNEKNKLQRGVLPP